jgi:hypothetical protein
LSSLERAWPQQWAASDSVALPADPARPGVSTDTQVAISAV